MILNPRQHFQRLTQSADFHRELVSTDRFRDAIQAALLEQIMSLPQSYEPNEAVAAYNRIMGARDFIYHLMNIAETPKSLSRPPTGNLDHKL